MDDITTKAFVESLLSTKHYAKYSFTPLSDDTFTIIQFYESGGRLKWFNDIPNMTELDEWWCVVQSFSDMTVELVQECLTATKMSSKPREAQRQGRI